MVASGEVGKIIRKLCRQKEVELIEGHAMSDHIHLVLNVPPKYSIAMVMGYLKGKSAIQIHRKFKASSKVLTEEILGLAGTVTLR